MFPRTRNGAAAHEVLHRAGAGARIETDPGKPTGPYNRAADIARALLEWEPAITFSEGLDRTIRWYIAMRAAAGDDDGWERRLAEH